ncbi:MAG TPA: hypothetical protein VK468_01315 [Pyrinomonadaceae bacterium]|nr:hypothetical protein [Pyrinomonadaceae bacterium]
MKLKSEYLIVIDKNTHSAFYNLCDSEDELRRLIAKNDAFHFDDNRLFYSNELPLVLNVSSGSIEGKDQRYFRASLVFEGADDRIELYAKAVRTFRGAVSDAGGQLQTLSNDISAYYSEKCYPVLHYVENLMRKLLKFFMVTQVGKDWLVEAAPKDVKDALTKSKRSEYGDALYDLDFIHLGDFLFKSYPRRPLSDLVDAIDAAESVESLDVSDFEAFKPRSNWDRYFSEKVDCTDEYLKTRWEQLYDLRCKIAHNVVISKADYDQVLKLSAEVSEKLESAFDKIDQISIPAQEKELVAEELVSSVNALSGEFINLWRAFEQRLRFFAGEEAFDSTNGAGNRLRSYRTPYSIIKELHELGQIEDETLKLGEEVSRFRNALVHSGTFDYDEGQVRHYLSILRGLQSAFSSKNEKSTTFDEISNAVVRLGGGALVNNRIKLYRLNDGRVVKLQYSRFHPQHQTYWYGIAPNSYNAAKRSGCSEIVFVMGDVGFVTVPTDDVDAFLETAYVTNNPDGSLRHYHIYVTPPPDVKLKAPNHENDVDLNARFTATEEAQ